jgi:hypothetical protein
MSGCRRCGRGWRRRRPAVDGEDRGGIAVVHDSSEARRHL